MLLRLLKEIWEIIEYAFQGDTGTLSRPVTVPTMPQNEPVVVPPTPQPPAPTPVPKYDFSTPLLARHSARVIMDEYGLSWSDKDLLCACIMQESRFSPHAIGKLNSNGTQDFGLCQYNNGKYHGVPLWIGPGAAFSSVQEVLSDPEKNVRIMVKTFKAGHLDYWSSYKTGAYRQWLV